MKFTFILLALTGIIFFSACSVQNNQVEARIKQDSDVGGDDVKTDSKNRTPVLVELYTSEGCSSCPPADRLLEKIETAQPYKDAEIITLAFHVDYWDQLGWKDEFSSPLFSRRQDVYAQAFNSSQVYTPQMIVDGRSYFVGSDAAEATKAITANAKNEKADVEISSGKDRLNVKIAGVPKHEDATVFLAIAEDNLATNVKRGENSGRKLEHISVVRELRTLGMLPVAQSDFNYDQGIQFQPNWKKENLKFVVFVQENQSRRVLGVNRVKVEN